MKVEDTLEKKVSRGEEIYQLIAKLFPICRSITGEGVRQTMRILKEAIPLEIYEVPSGTQVFDWKVPREWNIRDAYIKDSTGRKIVDFKDSNLHVLNYSVPVKKKVSLHELKEHLYYLPEHPDWIPYRTSYYKDDWGFCITYKQFQQLTDDKYEVCIDSSLEDGSLTYAEYFLKGTTQEEVLISTHTCHPSLCNDNLSGIAVITRLINEMRRKKLRYSYRFIFIPATIGAITWLSVNEKNVSKIKHGLVATLLGDTGVFHYKKSRQSDAEIDQVVEYVLKRRSVDNKILDFFPYGYDERQFCSPGFNLPIGRLTRTPYGEYPEYHTSADNLDLMKPDSLEESLAVYSEVIDMLEKNTTYINLNPKCEPQLGKRGLYVMKGGESHSVDFQLALLWTLNMSDGFHSLIDIAEKSKTSFETIYQAAQRLVNSGLLVEK